jgi:hypothetical protein
MPKIISRIEYPISSSKSHELVALPRTWCISMDIAVPHCRNRRESIVEADNVLIHFGGIEETISTGGHDKRGGFTGIPTPLFLLL